MSFEPGDVISYTFSRLSMAIGRPTEHTHIVSTVLATGINPRGRSFILTYDDNGEIITLFEDTTRSLKLIRKAHQSTDSTADKK